MAMRPRRGGGGGAAGSRRTTRSGVVRSVYEDFKPVSEWQQDDESHILNIYLPGFMKEQIKVSLEGRSSIRVRGERLVAGNKWSRFQEDFTVPDNGEMNSARAKFRGGILSISIPREKVGKEVDDTRKHPTLQNLSGDQETKHSCDGNQKQHISPKGLHEASTQEKRLAPLKASAEPNNKQDPELTSTGNVASQDTEEKESSDPKNEHDVDADQRGRSLTPIRNTGNVTSNNEAKKESSETKQKHVASENRDYETKENLHEEGKEAVTTKTEKLEKNEATPIAPPEKHTDNKEFYGASEKQKHKKEMKGLTELNEERQLLVNMGVAMLVIVALTTYVAYNFASAIDKK